MRVHLATSAAHAGLAPDDRHLLRALRERGAEPTPVVWEDPLVDWAAAPVTVIRSTWDYTFRRGAYLAWARRAASATRLLNPAPVVEWSTHKGYLLDLARAGVPIVPTTLVTKGSGFDLANHVDDRGWPEIVIKPAVGASGQWAGRFASSDVTAAQAHLDVLLGQGDALVQPLLPSVPEEGELSVVWIDGDVRFAVRKRGAPGDFRVHNDFGGSESREDPDAEALRVARAAVAASPQADELLYARVDLVRGLDEELCVMEHELVEPELFFGVSAQGTAAMADAILRVAADA
jgi:glutathione synthase/RimK-type ligase-like ATP-grasp enzyme